MNKVIIALVITVFTVVYTFFDMYIHYKTLLAKTEMKCPTLGEGCEQGGSSVVKYGVGLMAYFPFLHLTNDNLF